jgi:hypothetical protein
MEELIWIIVLEWLPGDQTTSKRFRFSDRAILQVVLWAVLHDRPMCWACRAENWPEARRPAQLPHPSTVSRRCRRPELQAQKLEIHRKVVEQLSRGGRYGALDGRALLVGGSSKDPDARPGRAVGGLGRGYKLHSLVNSQRLFVCWEVQPLNRAEPTVGRHLLSAAPVWLKRIVADGLYDSMKLHALAAEFGRRLYTPVRQNRVGRRRQRRRLQLWRLWQRPVGRRLLASRDEIERTFGHSSNLGFGFKGLPAWARRQHRVERWMWGKVLLYHAYLASKPHAA